MRLAIHTSIRLFREAFDPPDPIVEIGSYYVAGHERLSDLRPLFSGREFIGCDIRPGPGVDRIEDAEAMSFADRSIGTVLMFEILEHLPHPHKAIAEARRVLRDDAFLALSVPFQYRLHGVPDDYWRFTASGIATLLEDFPHKIVFALGPRLKPSIIFAVAAPHARPDFASAGERFVRTVHETFQASRLRGLVSVLKERGRDFLGCLMGRAELGVTFFDPRQRHRFRGPSHEP